MKCSLWILTAALQLGRWGVGSIFQTRTTEAADTRVRERARSQSQEGRIGGCMRPSCDLTAERKMEPTLSRRRHPMFVQPLCVWCGQHQWVGTGGLPFSTTTTVTLCVTMRDLTSSPRCPCKVGLYYLHFQGRKQRRRKVWTSELKLSDHRVN